MFVLLLALVVGTPLANAQTTISKIDPNIFPKAQEGYKKMVIEVPYSDHDDDKKIEFYVGKRMDVDACNVFTLMGSFEKKELQGWGYDYYIFNTKGNVRSTLMGCPDQKKRNVLVSSTPELIDYNGKMPVIIYVPVNYEVQFKIFKAEKEIYTAAEVR